ncbi:MAG: fibronectin type III domain-containing protein [Candidatus Hydrogenedentes bacterium]|nr:fibronectin type III domain-containing protein [Candidatus Hydrogenedentota bacterium]
MRRILLSILLLLVATPMVLAHVGQHPSVHDTVAGIIERLKETKSHEELQNLTLEQVEAVLTEEERHVLATEHLSFDVNVPVTVYVVRDVELDREPFWLEEYAFTQTDLRLVVDGDEVYDVWKKDFDAGHIGLGTNSLTGRGDHYFVVLKPQQDGAPIEVTNMYPGQHEVMVLEENLSAYRGWNDKPITEIPAELKGHVLIRDDNSRRRETRLIDVFRVTPYPATETPDHIVLTWSDDPKTTQTIQWRTSTDVDEGFVQYQKKSSFHQFDPEDPERVRAETKPLENPTLVNDPVIHRHTATITGLEPDTTYVYTVGDGSEDGWTELAEFTTAPDGIKPFSFIYMGDAQNGLDRWGSLIHQAFRERPDAAFYVMAGDLVNRGSERDDWDSYFENAEGIFDRRQVVPCLGNHEYQNNDPSLYLEQFALPLNGPDTIGPERAYSFEYSNAIFVVLDSNQPVDTQTAWLEEQLANTDATWKFVVYHHPAYSSSARRDNPEVRKIWGAIFDKYHVDLALQGHDHAYLRTYPMKNEQRVDSPAEGTVYVLSVSGTKFYDQGDLDYIEFGMTNVATYQVLDIQISGDRLVYRAYDIDGSKRDELIIEK